MAGKSGNKSYFDKKQKTVTISLFMKELVEQYMKPELVLFRVLLVDNRWHDIRAALQVIRQRGSTFFSDIWFQNGRRTRLMFAM